MITVANGQGSPLHWWVGKKVTCSHCGRIVQLEVGDDNHPACIGHSASFFEIECQQCGKTATLSHEPKS